jgi:hypothetical protein
MGVDCRIQIPLDVPIEEVADAMGILAGLPIQTKTIESCGQAIPYPVVQGITYKMYDKTPGMVDILLNKETVIDALVDGDNMHSVYFHHCSYDEPNGKVCNIMSPPSTSFWCAIGKKLVNFFGGRVIFNDSDYEKGTNVYTSKRHCPVDKWGRIPSDGKPWDKYQAAFAKLSPLSANDLERAGECAAYE